MLNRLARILAPALSLLIVAPIVCAQQPARASKLIQPSTFAPPQPPAECPVAAASAIMDIPDDVDLVVVVENGTDLRASPIGDAAARFLAESGIVVDLTKAWKALGDQLGWSTQETFDRLLGKRVVLLSKSLERGGDRRWAILSDVSVDTEAMLKEKLQASPRSIVQGHQILTVENGAYELTSHHRGAAASGRGGGGVGGGGKPKTTRVAANDRVTLVLGPAGKGELFDEMLAVLSRAGGPGAATRQVAANNGPIGTMSAHEIFTLACQTGPTEVLVLAALDPALPEAAPSGQPRAAPDRWKDFVLLAGHRDQEVAGNLFQKPEGSTWRSRIVVRQTARRDELLKIDPSSDAPFRALASGALLAMVQNAPLPDVLGPWAPLTSILSILPIPEDAKKQMSAGQAVSVRTIGDEQRVSCTFARQTVCTEQLARTLDGEMTARLTSIEKQFGVDAPSPQNYAGVAPNAVRTMALACSTESAMSVFTSRPLAVSWAYPSQVAVNGPVNLNDPAVKDGAPCVVACINNKRPGWWVLNICQTAPPVAGGGGIPAALSATPGELLRSDANALLSHGAAKAIAGDEGAAAQTARWVWLASAQPAALEKLLPISIPDLNGFRSGLRRFDAVDLALRITEQGDVQGDVGLRLVVQPAAVAK
jgi:hypothetical protein